MLEATLDTAVFGAGCFWCVEAHFDLLKAVIKVEPGYTGGTKPNPTYEEISKKDSDHIEVVRVHFDSEELGYSKLVDVFFHIHDPTSQDRQGNDVGIQYRSAIFYENEKQKLTAESVKERLEMQHLWDKPIVTELRPLDIFYPAESEHNDYYKNNPDNPYCNYVIAPKIKKFKEKYRNDLKSS